MSFGARMKARREALGFSLRDVEQITDLSNAYICQLENDKIKKPSAHVVLTLCAAYAIDIIDALGWLGQPLPPPPKVCAECGQALPLAKFAIDADLLNSQNQLDREDAKETPRKKPGGD